MNGWIGERRDYLKIWSSLHAPDSEVFTLLWESKALLALNSAIASFMTQQAYQEIAKWTLTHFFYTGLVAAFATPWLLVSFSQASARPSASGSKERGSQSPNMKCHFSYELLSPLLCAASL